MRISRNFIFNQDPDSGLVGLVPTWIQNANPVLEVAHDMLEHRLQEPSCPFAAELQALGAMLALRVENGAFYQRATEEHKVLGLSIFEVLCDCSHAGYRVLPAGPTRRLHSDHDWAENLINLATHYGFETAYGSDDLAKPMDSSIRASLQDDVLSWVRKGYRSALARFEGLDLYTLGVHTFKRINEQSRKMVTSGMVGLGTPVRVSANLHNAEVSFFVGRMEIY